MKITILQKMSNTGSIHDLASDMYDIDIDMGDKYLFVVVCPAYYNVKPTRHSTFELALSQAKKMSKYGPSILDCRGNIDHPEL